MSEAAAELFSLSGRVTQEQGEGEREQGILLSTADLTAKSEEIFFHSERFDIELYQYALSNFLHCLNLTNCRVKG